MRRLLTLLAVPAAAILALGIASAPAAMAATSGATPAITCGGGDTFYNPSFGNNFHSATTSPYWLSMGSSATAYCPVTASGTGNWKWEQSGTSRCLVAVSGGVQEGNCADASASWHDIFNGNATDELRSNTTSTCITDAGNGRAQLDTCLNDGNQQFDE